MKLAQTLQVLTRAIDLVVDALAWVAGGICLLMALHVSADLVGRGFFDNPLPGTDEVATYYYMVSLSFLPLAAITRKRGHIMVELFTSQLPKKALLSIDALADLVTLLFVALVAWMAVVTAIQKTAEGEMAGLSTGYMPIWEARWILAVGFALMCVYSVLNLIKDVLALRDERG